MAEKINKKLKIIIGNEPYEDTSLICDSTSLTGYNCRCFYRNVNTVAFVVKDILPYKIGFESILNLIYFNSNINIREKYVDLILKNDWKDFVDDMYNHHDIVFINQNDIDLRKNKNKNDIFGYLKTSRSILACGVPAQEKIEKLVSDYGFKLNCYNAIHPSSFPKSLSQQSYIDDWVDITTNNQSTNEIVKTTFMI